LVDSRGGPEGRINLSGLTRTHLNTMLGSMLVLPAGAPLRL
jgi:hypothetical protein